VEGVHFVRISRPDGCRWYVYAWRGGPRIAAIDGGPKPRLSREMRAKIDEARESAAAPAATISGLIRDWRRSPEWAALADNTRATWAFALARIEARWGQTPLALWDDSRMVGKVVAWRDLGHAAPRAADMGVTVLARLLEWGRLRARVGVNVAAGVPGLYRGGDRSLIIWTAEDYDRFDWAAKKLELPQSVDVRDLAGLTGFRRADLAAVSRAEAAGEHAIVRTALKRSRGRRRRAAIPKLPETHELLERLSWRARREGAETLLLTSFGLPWANGASLGACFNRVRDHAGIVHPGNPELGERDRAKHLHDLRGTFVTRLCRAELTDDQIADITAWSPANVSAIRKTYVDDAAVVVAIGKRIGAAL